MSPNPFNCSFAFSFLVKITLDKCVWFLVLSVKNDPIQLLYNLGIPVWSPLCSCWFGVRYRGGGAGSLASHSQANSIPLLQKILLINLIY